MSVHFDPEIGRWIAVYGVPAPPSGGQQTATRVQIRAAQRLEGPWSAPVPLFAIPETVPSPRNPVDENLFCYAAKAHPQFAEAGQLLVTYVCNLFARSAAETQPVLERLLHTTDLYRPKALSIPIPSVLSEKRSSD